MSAAIDLAFHSRHHPGPQRRCPASVAAAGQAKELDGGGESTGWR